MIETSPCDLTVLDDDRIWPARPRLKNASFEVVVVTPSLVAIVDLDRGRSVTNDAEHVAALLVSIYGARRIAYRDTAGEWGELLHRQGVFSGFAPWYGTPPIVLNEEGT